jgi:hypothetical protein
MHSNLLASSQSAGDYVAPLSNYTSHDNARCCTLPFWQMTKRPWLTSDLAASRTDGMSGRQSEGRARLATSDGQQDSPALRDCNTSRMTSASCSLSNLSLVAGACKSAVGDCAPAGTHGAYEREQMLLP